MLSRQTLGRPVSQNFGSSLQAETLYNRSTVQGGATILTQYNRDNLEEDMVGGGANDEIDDLRRE